MQSSSTEVLSNSKEMTDAKDGGSSVVSPSVFFSSFNGLPASGDLTSGSSALKIPNSSAWTTPITATSGEPTIPPSKVTTVENTGKTPLKASSSKPHVLSQSRNEISLECVAPSSAWAQSSDTSGKSAASLPFSDPPSQKSSAVPPRTNIEQSPQSVNGYLRLPENVFVVCNHFLIENSKRPSSIKENIKACQRCENRSMLKYAVWNHNKRDYQEIRPYSERVPANVAFKVCPQFSMHVPCLRTQCSFPHGTEEQLMWTLEREGGELI